ncbi:MAG TPA: bifunctional DNA-binding transcriptional regulator/O6-methylguanine-DNA methyltransferase Ada [Gemmatimonadales bacterium]|nr:bifunctional DNA-binding transcriptional regulator/O6-methylguanine-DNA methyltransferase Ada [Gemmatimonadales bacterium]
MNKIMNGVAIATDEAARWSAVERRDAEHDGQFVFAVRTTGVYCRPSCPSRRPNRVNVEFFNDPAAAEAAGYRACLRCEPKATATRAERAVAAARARLDADPGEVIPLAELARGARMSADHLQRLFRQQVGVSPKQYAAALRADRLKRNLQSGATVSRASYDAGYGASSRVYDSAARGLGMTPAAYRRGGKGVRIRFASAETGFGWVQVAATDTGVCSVMLGDDPETLARELEQEFPNATRLRKQERGEGDADLHAWLASVVGYLEGVLPGPGVPLDVRGTALQEKVWSELRRIPYGETRTYTEVAQAVGAPRAVRAVASACARNPVALVIPCHRVVGRDGDVRGYRWGRERKERLLRHEHAVAVRMVGRGPG